MENRNAMTEGQTPQMSGLSLIGNSGKCEWLLRCQSESIQIILFQTSSGSSG